MFETLIIEKNNSTKKVLQNLNILISSKCKYPELSKNGESTAILKCPKCNSYYIWNRYNCFYPDEEPISIKKYIPKIDDKGLTKLLKNFEGIMSEEEIDDYSGLYSIIKKEFKSMLNENKRGLNENKN